VSPLVRRRLRWAIAVALAAVLVAVLDVGQLASRLAGADLRLAVPAIAGLVAVHLIAVSSWRRLTANLVGRDLAWPLAVRLYYAALAVGTVTPANIGADVYRVTALRDRAAVGRLTRVVVVQRLTSLAAVAYLGVVGALALPIDGLGPFVVLVGMLGAALAVAVVFLSSSPGRMAGLAGSMLRQLGLDDAGTFHGRLRSALVDGFGFGLAFHLTSLVLGFLLVAAVDPAVAGGQPIVVLASLAVARLSLALPITPNGIGVQEGLLGVLFFQLGLAPETAIAAALLNRLALLLAAGLGALSLASSEQAPAVLAARR
jgi:uncharacterized membrane protein YbhN (UPF0104 family)